MTNIYVAIAILYRDGKFLCQLRDDVPHIRYPGHWALFGGHMEPEETPEVAVLRELKEEISYAPPSVSFFCEDVEGDVIRHVFHAQLDVDVNDLVLLEGWDLKLLTPEEIRAGKCFSQQSGDVRPLGVAHQRILLNFIADVEGRSQRS
ncbi:MAG: NUDIX domain-containing protein [Oscillatoriales cyanobacterium]|uniref:NUDIX hydrolase n=1 Tax=Microcoleus anatoxicus PTRS2 TaxID=2705321 RepID=A0ABU8YGC6_9CYAN|nr:MAG: NUDIX domain-containing protein [Oscillatoriales cyanobacterium]TAD96251.1 MAG: NUDIX domain-containing protein [Oscillatoriales cyanobacterium]TAE05448.1 MAG: NUDIX domain-containing protein [Oscillatoriales cyanobacterium]TAF04413.1 MAG: NUDIX domain-containing protein [Oscillatoriales cyanobacterium]TAF63822.1 MAG: NUDIX domain-containing protein [Oscillatoriales cyanobacterium]